MAELRVLLSKKFDSNTKHRAVLPCKCFLLDVGAFRTLSLIALIQCLSAFAASVWIIPPCLPPL